MDHAFVLLLALVIDALVGDPPALYKKIPHPVVLLGGLIHWGERLLNHGPASLRRSNGLLLAGGVTVFALGVGATVSLPLGLLPGGGLIEAAIASTLLAGHSLYQHVSAVAQGLRRSLKAGRGAVAHIVGRDPDSLNRAGVARAAIESAAENFSDGLIAPAFWFLLLGLPGLCAYKAINTLDSMIGHRNERYIDFGRASARLDDLANWLPARLSGALLVAAAWLLPQADSKQAWETMRRDAANHRSPNAGWPEAAVAGALDFALAGPRRYGDNMVDDAWMGSGRSKLDADDVDSALRLCLVAAGIALLIVAVLAGL